MNICWLYYFTYFYKCYTFNLQLDIVLRMCHRLLRLSISRPDLNSFSQPLNQAHLLCSLYQFVTHHIHPRSQVRNLAFLLSPAPCIKLIPKSHWFNHIRWLVFLPMPFFTSVTFLLLCLLLPRPASYPSPVSLWLIPGGSGQEDFQSPAHSLPPGLGSSHSLGVLWHSTPHCFLIVSL